MKPNHDSLIDQLKSQATQIDPDPPAGLRRKVFEALSQARPGSAGLIVHPLRWLLAGACALLLVVGAVVIIRQQMGINPPAPIARSNPNPVSPGPALPMHDLLASANPAALAERLMDDPLERELNSFLTGISQARDTITRPLPAPRKPAPSAAPDPL